MVDLLIVQTLPLPLLDLIQRLFGVAQRYRRILGHSLIVARLLHRGFRAYHLRIRPGGTPEQTDA
jgi:hypothetical protein